MHNFSTVLTKLLVGLGRKNLDSFEVANLEGTSMVCDDPPSYPLQGAGATGQLINGKVPMVCGGVTELDREYVNHCECHSLIDGVWKEVQLIVQIDRHWLLKLISRSCSLLA